MARRGRAGAALAIAAIGSFIAGCVGTTLIIAFGPALASVVTAFGSPEYFALMVLGLLAVAATQGSLLGALAMVLLGTMLGLVGRDDNTGYPRFTFGLLSLSDGIGFVPLTIGLFGLAEIMHNLDDPEKRGGVQVRIGRLLPSREEWRRALPAILRGTGLGCFLGMLPGGGATLSSFASYALEKQISPRREEFGHGAVEGLAGPEAANNAGAQTAFIPLLTLGLPSNAVMALLVGGMMIHGIIPGPNVMADQPELFWGMVLSMFLGNALLVVINLPFVGLWVQFLRIPYRYLYPGIFLFCCIGVYSVNNNLFDVWLSLVFALLGYFLLKVRLDPTPLILGFVLGPILENNFRRTLMLSNGDFSIFLQRPVALFLLLTAAALVILPAILRRRHRRGTSN
jgi:TctA family transporter